MKDHHIILEPFYGTNYHETYKLLRMFSFSKKKWHDCTNVLMKSMYKCIELILRCKNNVM